MSGPPPIPCRWDGEAFAPLPRFARRADEHFVIGEVYHLEAHQERSAKSHRHFFAIINDVFDNLPEHESRWPTAEHLRKWALIKAGHCDVETIACTSRAEALRWGPVLGRADAYCVVSIRDTVVMRFTARSISAKAVKGREFQAIKDEVFRVLAELIAVPAEQLQARERALAA